MKLLAIDTSTRNCSLALAQDEKISLSKNIILKDVLSSSMMREVEKSLKRLKWPFQQIDAYIVGLGPGSFTSLRIGLSTVKGFAFATGKPVIGISSLDAIALNVKTDKKDICVLTDAKRNMVYGCLYRNQDGRLKKKTDYLLSPISELLKRIKNPALFTGDGIKLFKEEITRRLPSAQFAPGTDWHPTAENLLILAKERIKKRQFDRAAGLIPIYLYPDDCQVQK